MAPPASTEMPPPPPPIDHGTVARLYDGDADVTKDELAALARRVPGEAMLGTHDEPRGTTLQAVRPVETQTIATESARGGHHAMALTAPPHTATPAVARTAPSTEAETAASSDRLRTLDERPRRRWMAALAALVLLAALGGLAMLATLLFRGTPTHVVPDLAGLEFDAARSQVAGFEWELDVRNERSDEQPTVGRVVRTAPTAGSDLAEGAPFLVVVSDGPELRTLPELEGMTAGEAETALAARGLSAMAPTEQFDEEAPVGQVVSWSVPADGTLVAGGQVLPETEVAIVVSSGPEPRRVPEVVGQTVEEATSALRELRLEVVVAEAVFDNDVPEGAVISIAPVGGEVVERGAIVELLPSRGQDLVVVPDLSGLSLPLAREALAAAGLQIGAVLGNSLGTFDSAAVGGADAVAGDEFLRNSAVDLVFL